MINHEELRRICMILAETYGEKSYERRDPVETLIRTILSHSTNDRNAEAAFRDLIARFSYEELLTASEDEIADAIRKAGLSRVKAKRLKNALSALRQHASHHPQQPEQQHHRSEHQHQQPERLHGEGQNSARRARMDMRFLADMDVEEAKRFLMSIPGIGQKTASCILCLAFGRCAFPVDTHIKRIFSRIFSINDANAIANAVENCIPHDKIYEFHLNLIEHGRKVCRARDPLCDECVLSDECASRLKFISSSRHHNRVIRDLL